MTKTENKSSDNIKQAIWTPGWYELDQSLSVGQNGRFWFFKNPPKGDVHENESIDLLFFNQLASAANCQVLYATVVEIVHAQLGPLKRIDTDGLDYIFCPVTGPDVIVNAEENPGSVEEGPSEISDWSVRVRLADVSQTIKSSVA